MSEIQQKSKADLFIEKVYESAKSALEPVNKIALEMAENCSAIIINDENMLGMAVQTVSKAKAYRNTIEAKRKEIKAPYHTAGQKVDEVAKSILDPLDKAIEGAIAKMNDWNKLQEQKAREEQEKINKIKEALQKIQDNTTNKIEQCKTVEDCVSLAKSIEEKFPALEKFGPLKDSALTLKNLFLSILGEKKQMLISGKLIEEYDKKSLAEILTNEIKETVAETTESIQANTATTSQRSTWKFEIVKPSEVKRDWLSVDEKKIKEWLKTAKEDGSIEDGVIINGVRFFIDKSVVIR